jgi:RNA polymerase sigma factor (sigma-70 family)
MRFRFMADVTCWTLIEDAAAGDRIARDAFVERYLPVVRVYLEARWRSRLSSAELDDALQEVFVECLKDQGLLESNRTRRGSGFRAYLFGAVRNIALRVEAARRRKLDAPRTAAFRAEMVADDEDTSSRVFDRAWAASIMRQAAEKLGESARDKGSAALRRVELLRLVFQENRGIADVAREWELPAPGLRREYARAREEFAEALREVVAFHAPGTDAAVERECRELMGMLA